MFSRLTRWLTVKKNEGKTENKMTSLERAVEYAEVSQILNFCCDKFLILNFPGDGLDQIILVNNE